MESLISCVITQLCDLSHLLHSEVMQAEIKCVCQGNHVSVRLRSLTQWPHEIIHNDTTTNEKSVFRAVSVTLG